MNCPGRVEPEKGHVWKEPPPPNFMFPITGIRVEPGATRECQVCGLRQVGEMVWRDERFEKVDAKFEVPR